MQRPTFTFGTASAAWQYEGAPTADGRGPSIWEEFCGGDRPDGTPRCAGGGADIAAIAEDQHNATRLRSDIGRMKKMGMTAYRLSLSWSRIMPTGRSDNVSQRGLDHYRRVLTMLREEDIEPWVTLFHFDLPLPLEQEEGGWLNRSMSDIRFAEYAEVCFLEFGHLVNRWMTINEAHTIATAGYLYDGVAAPGRCSNRSLCSAGNGTTEPYIVAHNLLRAHAEAVRVFRGLPDNLKGTRGDAVISMVISGDWTEPYSSDPRDIAAAQRRQEFQIGWFADPIFFGNYPQSMRDGVAGGRLPEFTAAEKALLKGSADFFALNHYTSRYGQAPGSCSISADSAGWDEDQCCNALVVGQDGSPIGSVPDGSDWLYIVPWGMRKLVNWVSDRYPRAPIWVTENGVVDPASLNGNTSLDLNDTLRIDYHRDYLTELRHAIFHDGADVRGYFVWSLLDNVEWGDGLRDRFGLFKVERPSLQRVPKRSVLWFQHFIETWYSE